jgi:16S rRNA (cytosine967-C5)-methyltransferase
LIRNHPRQLALELLNRVGNDDAYANLLMPTLLRKATMDARDGGLAQELGFSTLRYQLLYDSIIDQVSSRKTREIDPVLLNCLRLGVHQLLGTRIPAHAALSETVELVRTNCGEKVVGFANGILRTISKHDLANWIIQVTRDLPEIQALAIKHSHPVWIVTALKAALTSDNLQDQLEHLLEANNQPALVNLVALPGFPDPTSTDLLKNPFSPYGYALKSGNPSDLQDFAEGNLRVQDEGSQLAAIVLAEYAEIKDSEVWLDMCAGPGGKAALLAALGKIHGAKLIANEISDHRAQLVKKALKLFPEVEVRQRDGRAIGSQEPNRYDRILLDAPCTGLGALRRRPEARWRKSAKDLKELTTLQYELLASALAALKSGGKLLYVTCSPHLSETTAIIAKAQTKLGAEVLDLTTFMNAKYMAGKLPAGRKTVQLFTHRDNTDSMFYALLTKQ